MPKITATTNIILDFEINEEVKTSCNRDKKTGASDESKEVRLGRMVEERHQLDKALSKKKMTFSELLTFLNKR